MFGIIEEPKNEEMIKLKILFEALDRPEFLGNVPKVRKFHLFCHVKLIAHLFAIHQFLNHQETVTNVETLKTSMILLVSGRMDGNTIRHALIAFTLMERSLIHFEDNYREIYKQAENQVRREELGTESTSHGHHGGRRKESPMKMPKMTNSKSVMPMSKRH